MASLFGWAARQGKQPGLSRQKVTLRVVEKGSFSVLEDGGIDAPVLFKCFLAFLFREKKILLLVAYRETMFGKTITFFYQKNNNLNDPDQMTTSLTYPAEETLLTDYECINASRRRRNVALKEDSIEFLDPWIRRMTVHQIWTMFNWNELWFPGRVAKKSRFTSEFLSSSGVKSGFGHKNGYCLKLYILYTKLCGFDI